MHYFKYDRIKNLSGSKLPPRPAMVVSSQRRPVDPGG